MQSTESAKLKLKNKLKEKKKKRMNQALGGKPPILEEDNLSSMLGNMSNLLNSNPDLVAQLSKCVNNIMKDKTLIDNITKNINNSNENKSNEQVPFNLNEDLINSITKHLQDQTLVNNSEGDEPAASEN